MFFCKQQIICGITNFHVLRYVSNYIMDKTRLEILQKGIRLMKADYSKMKNSLFLSSWPAFIVSAGKRYKTLRIRHCNCLPLRFSADDPESLNKSLIYF